MLLDRNEEALRWRLALADDAVAWLDLQYYLWYRDDAGRLLLEAVLRAADRGVRVRILVDDLLFFGRDRNLRAVDAHPNVQVRLANPWRLREGALGRLVEFLSRMGRLNHRMHNKAMIADGRVAIVGGRNLGDAYFGLSEHSNFHDLDLLAVGPIVRELAEAFGRYWNSELVVEAEALPSETSRDALDGIREKIRSELRASSRLERFPQERADWSERLASLPGRLDAGSAKIIVDAPSLHAQREGESYRSLLEALSAARREVLVENAYWVPSEGGLAVLDEYQRRGVRLRVLTNSLASHDVPAVNSAYKKWRSTIVDRGVELYEIRHDAAIKSMQDTSPVESRFLGLHSKAFVVDGETVYVGSHNFDPRSAALNTELGMLVRSAGLAAKLKRIFERDVLPSNAWRVRRDEEGALVWESEAARVKRQPARSSWQRLQDAFLGILPIEDQL